MKEKDQVKTASSKLNDFLKNNRKFIVTLFVALIVALVAFVVYEVIKSNNVKKGLTQIDSISYEMTKDALALEEAKLTERKDTAKEQLKSLLNKGGIVGARANLLAAEIEYNSKNYDDAITYYAEVTKKSKKSYLAAMSYYNIAACYEQKKDLASAAENYKLACDYKDFVLLSHAKLNYGRILYEQGNFENAATVLQELVDSDSDDSWTKLAHTLLIQMKADGKIN